MQIVEVIFGVILIAICVFIIAVVVLQEINSRNLGALGGGQSETYFGKNSGRTREAMLKKLTKYAAVLFFVLTLAAAVVSNVVR